MTEWIDCNKRMPNVKSDKLRVRRSDGTEQIAYYYSDRMNWVSFYGQKTGYWWDTRGDKRVMNDVTHWLERDEK